MHDQSTALPTPAGLPNHSVAQRAIAWAIRGQETRRSAFYSFGAMMCAQDTSKMHGPALPTASQLYWLESDCAARGIASKYTGPWIRRDGSRSEWVA